MGRLTTDEAAAALAAMQPENRADVEAVMALPNYSDARAVKFAQLCHLRQWSRKWAEYVWDVCHPVKPPPAPGQPLAGGADFDDDIPF
jgi:hypothetical protein